MYEITHKFKPETIEAAVMFKLHCVNERDFYNEVIYFFKNLASVNIGINNSFPYCIKCTEKEYKHYFNQINKTDTPHFARLCRVLIYEHYYEEFVKPFTVLSLMDQVKIHLDKADKHFRGVENTMNTLTKYENKPTAMVHLIHGKPVEDYTEKELVSLIRKARQEQEDIKDLVATSERMKSKHTQLEEAIKVYVKALDNLKD